MTMKTTGILACCISMGLLAALAPTEARADGTSLHPGIGGHVGVAIPLVFLKSNTQTIGDQFTLAYPIGIGFKITEKAAIDFETVVANPISPRGTTSFTVDPGIVYDTGSFVLGLRLGWDVNAATNFKVIPLIHKGVADIGAGASWFVEAAFPATLSFSKDIAGVNKTDGELDIVFHTGIGF